MLLLSIATGWLFHCPTARCLLLTPIRPAVNKISLTFYSSLKSHSIAYLNKRAYVLHISSKVVYNLTNHHHPRHLSRQPESVLSCPIFFVLLQHNVRANRSPAHRKTIATGTHGQGKPNRPARANEMCRYRAHLFARLTLLLTVSSPDWPNRSTRAATEKKPLNKPELFGWLFGNFCWVPVCIIYVHVAFE